MEEAIIEEAATSTPATFVEDKVYVPKEIPADEPILLGFPTSMEAGEINMSTSTADDLTTRGDVVFMLAFVALPLYIILIGFLYKGFNWFGKQ